MTAHLEPRARYGPPAPPRPLSAAARAELGRLFALEGVRAESVRAQHCDRIARVAYATGRRCGLGEMLLPAALDRIDSVVFAPADDAPVARLTVPAVVGREVASDAFERGVRSVRGAA